ncbi:MAG: LPS assembly protein LptD [Candidatus Omnitrophica bacterium]|nr:LPS assembly protein LptD [Candidatus Omnitrophota bacterium]
MKFILCIIIFIFAGYSLAFAAEAAAASGPVEVNGDQVEYFPKEKKVVGTGNVIVDYGDVSLTCGRITVYTETKDAEAEGDVVLKTPTGEVRGERVKYNFTTKEGEILKARIKSGEWYSGGEKIGILSDGSYRVTDGYITSCDLPAPHYKIKTKSITIYPDNRVVAKNVIFAVGNVPVAFLPSYDYSLDGKWPSVDVIPGKKKKWGVFALTSYRYDINKDDKLTLRIDEREHWGMGQGLDYKYSTDDFGQGLLKAYYAHQRNVDRNESVMAEEDRYRVQLRHRWDINDNVIALVEFHKINDADVIKDYFYREEYDRESSPESYLYVLNSQPEYAMSFLTRKRVNHFQAVTERLPEFRFNLKDQALFDLPVYFKTDTALTNLVGKTANNVTDTDVIRFDTYNKLTSPLRLADFLSVSPFVGTRDTFYSKDINGDEDKFRTAFYAGVDVGTKFFKTYGSSGKFMGVEYDKLHHIITPTIEYEYIHSPSTIPGGLQQFDDIDNVARKNAFTMGLENKLETKRLLNGKLRTYDLGYFLITGDYSYKPENGSRFSNVKGDIEITPYDWLRIESDTLYDPDSKDFQDWNLDCYMENDKDWRVGFGSRYWQDTEHELTSELFYKLNSEWSFRLFGRYDLKEVEASGNKVINKFDTKEISVIKDLHCWIAEASLDIGRDGGTTVWFAMKLKASPKIPFDFNDYYAIPKR